MVGGSGGLFFVLWPIAGTPWGRDPMAAMTERTAMEALRSP
jgi:hypothetical protein